MQRTSSEAREQMEGNEDVQPHLLKVAGRAITRASTACMVCMVVAEKCAHGRCEISTSKIARRQRIRGPGRSRRGYL